MLGFRPHLVLLGCLLTLAPSIARGQSTSTPQSDAPTGELTLERAIAATLELNPRLRALALEQRAVGAEVAQARVRPNPELAASVENFAGSGALSGTNATETTITVSQPLEWFGKAARRTAVADSHHRVAELALATARREESTLTTLAFVDALAARDALALAQELATLAEDIVNSVVTRVNAGAGSRVEESRARLELEARRIDVAAAESRLANARRRLAVRWGSSSAQFTTIEGDLEAAPRIPARTELDALIDRSPQALGWRAEVNHQSRLAEYAETLARPDVTVGLGGRYVHELDDAAVVAEVSIPLAIFDRNRGASQAARLRVEQAQVRQRAAEAELRTELATLYQSLLTADREVQLLRERVLPEARTAYEEAQAAYSQGRLSFTDVLDTERQLFELNSRYLGALVQLHTTVAQIEGVVGPVISAKGSTR